MTDLSTPDHLPHELEPAGAVQTHDRRFRSGPINRGQPERSGRTFTRPEIAAAKRQGYVDGKEKHDSLGGPLFFKSHKHLLAELKQKAQDYALLVAAAERENSNEATP